MPARYPVRRRRRDLPTRMERLGMAKVLEGARVLEIGSAAGVLPADLAAFDTLQGDAAILSRTHG
jgi:hypothetical protein